MWKVCPKKAYFVDKTASQKINVRYHTADKDFDHLLRWISFQPFLRRIYGCSFLPHYDYGRGGRGWRDLWQDCLSLLLKEVLAGNDLKMANGYPERVRAAMEMGLVSCGDLEACARRVLELILKID